MRFERKGSATKKPFQHFEGAYDAIWVYDLEGNIQSANKAAARLNGYPVEELLGMNIKSFLTAESLHLASEVQDKLTRHEPTAMPYEQRIIKKDGSEAICLLATSLISSNGEPKGFQSIARDVTEEKRMQENLSRILGSWRGSENRLMRYWMDCIASAKTCGPRY